MTLNFGGGDLFGKADDEGRKKKELHFSIAPCAFIGTLPLLDNLLIVTSYIETVVGATIRAPVQLPHRSVITGAILKGNAGLGNVTWSLLRNEIGSEGTQNTIVTALADVFAKADQAFSDVDVFKYSYTLIVANTANNDKIYGAVITYTI